MYIYYILLIITALTLSCGCAKKPDVVARIGERVITTAELKGRLHKLPDKYRELVSANMKKYLDEFVVDELLYQEALRRGLQRNKDVIEIIEEAKKKILIAKLLKDNVDDEVTVSDEEAMEYYQKHPEEFRTPEIFRASHIMVRTPEEADQAMEMIKSGVDFAVVAKEKSVDTSAGNGGDVGYFVAGQIDPDFERECVKLSPGGVSGIIRTRYGYHIIKLTEKKASGIESFDEVKERIRHNLAALEKKKTFNDLVDELKKESKIQIDYEKADEAVNGQKKTEVEDKVEKDI